jgi:hypothetical protein
MAGDWIKVEHCLPDKPEVHLIARILGIDPDAVVGKLVRLWCWADAHTVSGEDIPVLATFVDRMAFQPGFADALVQAGWLVVKDDVLTIPRFGRHNGHTAKARALAAERKANERNLSRSCHAASVTKPGQKRDICHAPVQEVSQQVSDNAATGAEIDLFADAAKADQNPSKGADSVKTRSKKAKCHAASVTEMGHERDKSVTREEKRRDIDTSLRSVSSPAPLFGGDGEVEAAISAPAKQRERNPLFDALASVDGSNPQEVQGAAARAIGVALAEIRRATPDVTPDEIKRRAAMWPRHFPDAVFTPTALAKWWARLAKPPLNGSYDQIRREDQIRTENGF